MNPVVFGLHGNHEKIVPRHSFINAAKFENTKQLADYLMGLDKNDTLHNQYFWWKPHFTVSNGGDNQNLGYCTPVQYDANSTKSLSLLDRMVGHEKKMCHFATDSLTD